MALKSYRLRDTLKKKKKKLKPVKDIVTGGITALVGVALVSEVADLI